MDTAEKHNRASRPLQDKNVPLKPTAALAFLSLSPLADLSLELQLVGEEHLSPAHLLGQGPHVRGDVVTGRLNYQLPQLVRPAQLWVGKSEGGSVTHGPSESHVLTHKAPIHVPLPVDMQGTPRVQGVPDMVPAPGEGQVHKHLTDKKQPWQASSVGESTVPIHQSCRFNPWSGPIQAVNA